MILSSDDANNIIDLLDICERDFEFRLLVEKELRLLGLERNLTKKTRSLIAKGVWASIGMSLNYEVEEKTTVEDMMADEAHNTEELVMKKFTNEKLFESLERLPPLEMIVTVWRYGLKGQKPMSYKDISSLVRTSPQEVVEIETRALKKLKGYMLDEPVVDDYKGAVALLLAISWGIDDRP